MNDNNTGGGRQAAGGRQRAAGGRQPAEARSQKPEGRKQEAGGRRQAAEGGVLADVAGIRRRILGWYRKCKRDLPWRLSRDPYRVWVSEIMLQQTRVAAVIPYYERFLERFPDVNALASAPEQELLAAWAGLGYYSRARNLQKAAQKIRELGGFPRDYSSLRSLAGVGDYTAAAIASIAFDLPHAVLDGNVLRVLSRFTGERGNVDSVPVRNRLRGVAEQILAPKRAGEFNQALMELGATVCLPRQPQCPLCPVARLCVARQLGRQTELPVKSVRPSSRRVDKELLVIERAGKILIWQRPGEHRRLAGFWELPEPGQLIGARVDARIGEFRHTIVNTNFRCQVFRASLVLVPEGFRWLERNKIHEVPLSTTARKALAFLAD
jgi:A/G-specific adenine glycosylase